MKATIIPAAVLAALLAVGTSAGPAQARGCIKGAIIGGIAGHYAGHHGFLGAAGGCVAGRYMSNRRAAQTTRTTQPSANANVPQTGNSNLQQTGSSTQGTVRSQQYQDQLGQQPSGNYTTPSLSR